MTQRERERERANSGKKCPNCLNPETNHKPHCPDKCNKCNYLAKYDISLNKFDNSKCHNPRCDNYYLKHNKPPSKFKRERCPECGRSNVIINPESGLCNSCGMAKLRLMIQQMIKEHSLKEGQIEWERVKPQIEQMIRFLKQNGEQEVAKMIERNIETIEGDLYPNRKKNKGNSTLIWVLVIVGVIIIFAVIGYFLWKKKKK